jgi:hypothetical protein
MPNWNDIYDTTTFMAHDKEGNKVFFTQKEGLPKSIKNKPFAIITAWNPDHKELSLAENKARNESLKDDLITTGLHFYPSLGTGTDGHSEESFTVEDIALDEAVRLGRKYGQYAIAYNDSLGFRFER